MRDAATRARCDLDTSFFTPNDICESFETQSNKKNFGRRKIKKVRDSKKVSDS